MKSTLLLLTALGAATLAGAQYGQHNQNAPRSDLSNLLRSGIEAFTGNRQDGQISLQQLTSSWHETARAAAKQMFEKYGPPQEVSAQRLVWHGNGPWKTTTVVNQEVPHNFPAQHNDVLIQTVAIDVPVEKFSDIAQFDGSVTANRTQGELTAACDREEHNFIALNLASDVISGKLSVPQARQRLSELAQAVKNGQQPSYATDIRFSLPVSTRTGDPDRPDSRGGDWQRIGW